MSSWMILLPVSLPGLNFQLRRVFSGFYLWIITRSVCLNLRQRFTKANEVWVSFSDKYIHKWWKNSCGFMLAFSQNSWPSWNISYISNKVLEKAIVCILILIFFQERFLKFIILSYSYVVSLALLIFKIKF